MRTVVWQSLSEEQQDAILERPAIAEGANITAAVADVIAKVRTQGDAALLELTEKFDRVKPESIRVPSKEINAASERLSAEMKQALEQAYSNIAKFHKAQKPQPIKVETQPGVMCEQVTRPIQKVGLYIPGGSAPLPSTVLMLGVPAKSLVVVKWCFVLLHRLQMKFCTLPSCAALMKFTMSVVDRRSLQWRTVRKASLKSIKFLARVTPM